MIRKDELISMMPRRKDGKIDWLSAKGMEIKINSCNDETHKVKVLDVYGDDAIIYLKLEYIGDADYNLTYWEHIEC